jgi:hypothetical protein
MSTTHNHFVLSRAQFAEASELAAAGSTALARTHLLFAADHALLALAARSAIEPPHLHEPRDRFSIAARLADIGAAPREVAPVLRDLNDADVQHIQDPPLTARLTVGFALVQRLIDAHLDHTASRGVTAPPASLRLYGGSRGAMHARGAEAAARGMQSVAAAVRSALRR